MYSAVAVTGSSTVIEFVEAVDPDDYPEGADKPEDTLLGLVNFLLEMGAVFRLEVKDQQRSIDTYKRILELDPSDLQAIALSALVAAFLFAWARFSVITLAQRGGIFL